MELFIIITVVIMALGVLLLNIKNHYRKFNNKILQYKENDVINFYYKRIKYENYYLHKWSDKYFKVSPNPINTLNNSTFFTFEWNDVEYIDNLSYNQRKKENEMNSFMNFLNDKIKKRNEKVNNLLKNN